ncbi:MAG: DUF2085 domain-containing protein [Culicoidibacterales bacterium]
MEILYKWLPICFGCHCRSERSFHWQQRQFPICARCTGELVGMIAAIGLFFVVDLGIGVNLLLMLPMIVDGFVQLLTRYESTNWRRLITGILFGYGLVNVYVHSLLFARTLGEMFYQYLF